MEKVKEEAIDTENLSENDKEAIVKDARKKLKRMGKSNLVNIIVNLSAKIDNHIEKNKRIKYAVNKVAGGVNESSGFISFEHYKTIMEEVKKDV